MGADKVIRLLLHMTSAAQGRNFLRCRYPIRRDIARRLAMLQAGPVADAALHALRRMLMRFKVADLFAVARCAHLWLLCEYQKYKNRQPAQAGILFTSPLEISLVFRIPAKAMASFNSAFNIHSTRSTPG